MKLMTNAIEIIGTESLGVRGLCCRLTTAERQIVIDPGVALGYKRHGLLPHPRQVAQGEVVQRRIISALKGASDVVFSHFHGDHIPLREANPYQLALQQLPENFKTLRAWSLDPSGSGDKIRQRANDLAECLGPNLQSAENSSHGSLSFSPAMPHGVKGSKLGTVMMTRVDLGGKAFVHASDIQLLDRTCVEFIIAWQADIVLAAGPPLYLERLNAGLRAAAWKNALLLANGVESLILDHHLMRDQQGVEWLDALSATAGKQVYCAADFMNRPRLLLEAQRSKLYQSMPVVAGWHDEYARQKR